MIRSVLYALTAACLVQFFLAMIAPPPAAAVPSRGLTPSGQTLPITMPVFSIQPYSLDSSVLLSNLSKFNQLYITSMASVITVTTPGGVTSLASTNSYSGNLAQQFAGTGGLFVLNLPQAFNETPSAFITITASGVCNFLKSRNLFPSEVPYPYQSCSSPTLAYNTRSIYKASSLTQGKTEIGKLIQIPMQIPVHNFAQGITATISVPLGGPGGHLSLLLSGSSGSLDSSLPGLQAFASPWFGRQLNSTPIGYYTVVPQGTAMERFMMQFPQEWQVSPGTPELTYYAGFPDSPQSVLVPYWMFPDATAFVSGTTVTLRSSFLPAVENFVPSVQIASPAQGLVPWPGQSVPVSFTITGAHGPFSYNVYLDDSVVITGTTSSGSPAGGSFPMPPSGERPEGRVLRVEARNSYGQAGSGVVYLGAPQALYLPMVTKGGTAAAREASEFLPAPSQARTPSGTYTRVGVEWVSNYHGTAPNLAMTGPDAEGLYHWLGSSGIGWTKAFNYGNDSAWEKDWRDCTLGGIDCGMGVDRAELVYFAGHGSPSRWYFGVSRNARAASAAHARFQNIRWSGFASCQTLRGGPFVGVGNPPLTEWFNSFQGSNMVLGFHSGMMDVAFGPILGFYLRNSIYDFAPALQPSIRSAWLITAFFMNAGRPSYLYAIGNRNPMDDKLPASTSAPLAALTGITEYRWVWWEE